MNSLLENFEFIPFGDFDLKSLELATSEKLSQLQHIFDLVVTKQHSSWDEIAIPLQEKIYEFNRIWGIVNHLMSVCDNKEIRDLYDKYQQQVTNFFINLGQNKQLYNHYEKIKQNQYHQLSEESKKVLDNEFRDFFLSGIGLPKIQQDKFKQVQNQLEQLSTKFAQNVLDATDSYAKYVEKADLVGVPDDILSIYRNESQNDEKPNKYKLTLHMPSYLPILQYCENRALREELYQEYVTRASELQNSTYDNSNLIQQILILRKEKAQLLGFGNYSELSLYTKMAKNYQEVLEFLNNLAIKAKPYAIKDLAELTQYASETFKINQLEAWDIPFFSEKLQQEKYSYSNHELKQYFQLPVVLDGLFNLVYTLYKIRLVPKTLPTWHKDVQTFAVINQHHEPIGYLYLDLYSRNGKHQGAWMNSAQDRYTNSKNFYHPLAYIVCNFTQPTNELPSLLTFDEVQTLFHEMGHALHHLLSEINSFSISGINGVEWDAVELPSQFMEYFTWNYEIIKSITKQIKTNQSMPKPLFDKLLSSRYYQAGLQMLRQIEFAIFDMLLHCNDNPATIDYRSILNQVRAEIAVIIPPAYNRFANSFTHIFAGGYASGYYSYKWAEVLATDIFSISENKEIDELFQLGTKFKDTILSKGGLNPMMNNFKAFMGRAPTIDALIKYSFGEK